METITHENLGRAVHSAFTGFRRDTGLEPKPEFLEVRIHSEDYDDLVLTANNFYFNLDALLKERGILGVPIVKDDTVERGHPKLRSTWEWVL